MKRISAVLLAMVLTAMAAPAIAQSPGSDDEKITLRIGTTNDVDSLNPFKMLEIPSFEISGLNYDLLVDFSTEDFSPDPALADSWEVSDDELTWTFHLNEDATFHDGEPVTSEDVKYTIDRIIEEKQGLFIDYVRQIEEITTPDEHTVVMRTKEPSVLMLSIFVPILPKHVWEDVPADETKSFRNVPAVGSGPFQVVEWRRGQFLRMEANPDYFGDAPKVDEIIMQFYDNADTLVQALKQGEVDYVYNIPANLFLSLQGEPDIETISAPDDGFTELAFNVYEPTPEAIDEFGAPKTSTGHPALLDVRVRQAINWAIDEAELADKILRGEGVVGSTVVPPSLASYHLELEDSEKFAFDPERAEELLAEAGWEDTNGNGTVDKEGEELELRLSVRSETSEEVKAGQFVEGWLEDVGIGVDTEAISDNTLTDNIYAADYDMFIWGWGSDPDPDFILSVLTCEQFMGWSDTFYCNEDYSRLYQEQRTQLDLAERAETIKEMQRIAYEDSPYVVFYYDNQLDAYRTDRFEGWVELPTDAEQGQVMFTHSNANYLNLDLASATARAETEDGGTSPAVWILVVLAAAAAVAVAVVVIRRRSEEDRA